MSILVMGMKMPDGCPFCPMGYWSVTGNFAGCSVVRGKLTAMFTDPDYADSPAKSRPDWCPLVEVPPHGLIDKGLLLRNIADNTFSNAAEQEEFDYWNRVWEYIRACPTVIPAEPEEVTS